MNENEFREINDKLKKLEKNFELLENENLDFKNRIKKNEITILNLNSQLIILKREYETTINKLKEYYNRQLEQITIFVKTIENKEGKDEIISNNKNNYLINIKENYEEIEKIIDKKLSEYKNINNTNSSGQISKKEMEGKKGKQKEKKEKKMLDNFQEKLSNIFFDLENKNISESDLNELKKLSTVLLFKSLSPLQIISEFFEEDIRVSNKIDGNEENIFNILVDKKINILVTIETITSKRIEFKNIDDFKKQFRIKYGISEKEYNDKELVKKIKKKNYEEKEIIKSILKHLKYLKD